MDIFSFFFGVFPSLFSINVKALVDRTKQLRYLKFGIWGLCKIANEHLSPFLKFLKATWGFVEKSNWAAKIGLADNSFWLRRLIFGMRDPRDDKSSIFVSFSKILIFVLLMAIFRFFLEFFLLYSLLNMKAPVDGTKHFRDLNFGI